MPDEHPTFAPLSVTAQSLAASRGGRPVFADVTFAVRSGEALVIRGPNGSGKSTLLRLVAGLLSPAAGKIRIAPPPRDGDGPWLHYVGHLDALKAGLTVADNLAFWARVWGSEPAAVEPALEALGLLAIGHLPVAVLSAGQRRRAALARLLLVPRPVWLLDEPTASLDAAAEAVLTMMIGSHLASGGIALIATHGELRVAAARELTLGAA
jgi:heme exporter protein A